MHDTKRPAPGHRPICTGPDAVQESTDQKARQVTSPSPRSEVMLCRSRSMLGATRTRAHAELSPAAPCKEVGQEPGLLDARLRVGRGYLPHSSASEPGTVRKSSASKRAGMKV